MSNGPCQDGGRNMNTDIKSDNNELTNSTNAEPAGPTPAGDLGEVDGTWQSALEVRDAELWPEPVDGKLLLEEIRAVLSRFVVLPKWGAETLALWVMHTYAFHLRDVSTYIGIESPEKRCGKTTLLTVLSELVKRPVVAANISPSAFFRVIEEVRPTLIIDEADTFLQGNDELRGILNSGYNRKTAFVVRFARHRSGESKSGAGEQDMETNRGGRLESQPVGAVFVLVSEGAGDDRAVSGNAGRSMHRGPDATQVERGRVRTAQATREDGVAEEVRAICGGPRPGHRGGPAAGSRDSA